MIYTASALISPQFAPFSAPNAPSIAVAPSITSVPYAPVVLPSRLPHCRVAVAPSIAVALALSIAIIDVALPSRIPLLSLLPSCRPSPSLLLHCRGAIHCHHCCRVAVMPSIAVTIVPSIGHFRPRCCLHCHCCHAIHHHHCSTQSRGM